MNRKDRRRKQAIHSAGEYVFIGRHDVCAYCGVTADSRDHVLPVSMAAMLRDMGRQQSLYMVAACRECNAIGGAKVFESLSDKRRYIQERLGVNYAKYLAIPDWNMADLLDLEEAMMEYIMTGIRIRDNVRLRMNWRRNRGGDGSN